MRTKFGLHLFIRIAVNVPFHRVIKPTMSDIIIRPVRFYVFVLERKKKRLGGHK